MAALVSKKRGMEDISSIECDPQNLHLQIFCSVRNGEETGVKKVIAVAQISTSGGNLPLVLTLSCIVTFPSHYLFNHNHQVFAATLSNVLAKKR